MNRVSSRQIKILQRRIDYLTECIDADAGTNDKHGYDIKEVAALKAVLQYIDDEDRNLIYKRVYKKAYGVGQRNILKFYKKALKQATHSGNVEALRFLLDRTNEWLDENKINLEKDSLE